MVTISLCMIVKNNAQTLDQCLSCTKKFVDEIIIVDTGSTDKTKAIAATYTDKIFDYHWQDNFASARNFSFSKATMSHCMWLHPSDTISEMEQNKICVWKQTSNANLVDVLMMVYDTAFDKNGKPTSSCFRERIIRNTKTSLWQGRLHEEILPFGNIQYEDIHIEQHKETLDDINENLRIYEMMLQEEITFSAKDQFYYASDLYDTQQYQKAIPIFKTFLEIDDALLEQKIIAHQKLAKCYGNCELPEKQIATLFQSFTLDLPRAEICCAIGEYYFEKQAWRQSAFWYEIALHIEQHPQNVGTIQEECYGYLPCIQLCICFDHLGEWEKARNYNEMAAVFRPESKAVAYNRRYFKQKALQQK